MQYKNSSALPADRSAFLSAAFFIAFFFSLVSQAPARQATVIRAVPMRAATKLVVPTPGAATAAQSETATPGAKPIDGTPNAASKAKTDKKAKKPSPEDALVKLLLAGNYQRTPKAILDAWSYREPKSKTKDVPKPKTFQAEVVNAFESLAVFNFSEAPKYKPGDTLIVESKIPKDKQDDEQAKAKPNAIGNFKVLSVEGTRVITQFEPQTPTPTKKKPTAKKPTDLKTAETKTDSPTKTGAESDSQAQKKTESPAVSIPNGSKDTKKPEKKPAEKGDAQTPAENKPIEKGEPAENPKPETETDTKPPTDGNPEQKPLAETPQAKILAEPKLPSDEKPKSKPKQQPEIKTGDTVSVTKLIKQEKEPAGNGIKKAEAFQRHVAVGDWDKVKKLLGDLKPDNAEKVYAKVLTSLAAADPAAGLAPPPGIVPGVIAGPVGVPGADAAPSHFLTPNDILELSELSPKPISLVGDEKSKNKKSGDGAATTPGSVPAMAVSPSGAPSSMPAIVMSAAMPAAAMPGLPPGVSLASLPPEIQAQLKASMGAAAGSETEEGSPHIASLAALIKSSQTAGHDFEGFVDALVKGTTHFGGEDELKKLTAADLLMKSELSEHVSKFLPPLDDDKTKSNRRALKIWSELALANYESKKVAEWLNKAWDINQAIVAISDLPDADKDKALTNLIQLSPQVDKEIGEAWLNTSFTKATDRGMVILTNLGSKSAEMAGQSNTVAESERLELLRLQNQAAEKLIEQSPKQAGQWNQALTLMIQNWLTEAETSLAHSKENRRSSMNIDMYGNFYWGGPRRNINPMGPKPIKLGDMLEIAPSKEWKALVAPSLHVQLSRVTANLHLRLNEEDKAFPYIEDIAQQRPKVAKDLVHKFLEIWTRNHDPNTDRNQRNPYIYFYGFDQKADAIPLTRSKQERNLKALSKWIGRIREMGIEDLDEKLLAGAFTTCHSSAEVFREEAVKAVFGDLDQLKPDTIAELCQKMRSDLASSWRDIRAQEAKQTNRREPEVQQEVLRGYEVGQNLIAEALKTSPENWKLHLAKACLMYEENAYAQTVNKSSEFSNKRDRAFDQFEVAAEKYQAVVATLEEKDHSTDVYDLWFYAGLGACDLGKVTDKTVADMRQYKKIRTAIESLPGALAETHMAKVANNMFTRMSPIKPEIKFRYLRGGFEIVGDHPRAWEARNLHDYYKDLVSEIELEVQLDGDAEVGHSQAFGAYVNIRHTKEIERESGGFSKYAQNQNGMMYAFNYGRPTEDYRDKFNDSINQALEEHFEILNVTFQNAESMQSFPSEKEGWRVTPYAYILLKARGSEIDRVAPLKLDLDFLDTSGYVVIPIESAAIVIDASAENGNPRPVSDLSVTQTLDERQAGEGKLIVEVTAKAKGLVPELDDIFDVDRDNFEVVSVDDQGVLPESFDETTNGAQILSNRSWTIEYAAKAESEHLENFSFSKSKLEDAEVRFQRYEGADLVLTEQEVSLEQSYSNFSWTFLYWLLPVIALGLVAIAAVIKLSQKPVVAKQQRFAIPKDINPFTVLTLLNEIRHRNGISTDQAQELDSSINRVQKYYFAKSVSDEQEEDLANLAQQWVRKTK